MAGVNKFLPDFDRRPSPGRRRKVRDDSRAIAEDIARIRNEEARREHQSQYLDSSEPKPVSPPSGRFHKTWKKRQPIFKGGAVIGRRSPQGFA